MKLHKIKSVFVTMFLVLASVAHAKGGGTAGNGGDAYALEFTTLARIIAESLANQHIKLADVDAAKFSEQIEKTKVVSLEQTILNDTEVDAINYPQENKIEISRSRWKEYKGDQRKKLGLILHEMLGVMNVNDDHYQISSKYLEQIDREVGAIAALPDSANWFKVITNSPNRVSYLIAGTFGADITIEHDVQFDSWSLHQARTSSHFDLSPLGNTGLFRGDGFVNRARSELNLIAYADGIALRTRQIDPLTNSPKTTWKYSGIQPIAADDLRSAYSEAIIHSDVAADQEKWSLFLAASAGDKKVIAEISSHTGTGFTDWSKRTPLIAAAIAFNSAGVAALAPVSDVNAVDAMKRSALDYIVQRREQPVYGSEEYAKSIGSLLTTLAHATFDKSNADSLYGRSLEFCVPTLTKRLIHAGAGVNTPLMYSAGSKMNLLNPLAIAATSGCFENVDLLLNLGADPRGSALIPPSASVRYAIDLPLNMALSSAGKPGKPWSKIVEALLSHGAEINSGLPLPLDLLVDAINEFEGGLRPCTQCAWPGKQETYLKYLYSLSQWMQTACGAVHSHQIEPRLLAWLQAHP